jgi:hypothetical protein
LCVTTTVPCEFWMAAPLPLDTVVWFGSLEFMSLGYDYDMVLLPLRALSDSDSSSRCQRHGRQPGHQGHHSCRAHRMRRARKNPRPCSGTGGDSPSSPKSSHPTARIGSLARDLPGMHLAVGKAPLAQGVSTGQRSRGSSRSMGPASVTGGPTAVPSSFPYGLSNAAMGYSRSMRSTMSSCMRRLEHHLCTPLSSLRPHR